MAGFDGISTLVGYLMPNPIYAYIKYVWCVKGFNSFNIRPYLSADQAATDTTCAIFLF